MSQRFRLGVVLRLREMAEEAARIDLSHALAAHQRALTSVEDALRLERGEMRWLAELQQGRARAGDLRSASDAVGVARRGLERAQQHLAAASDGLLESRRKLAEASRRREVVERLRDRFLAAERREADRRDAIVMSEIASTRYAYRAAEGDR